MDMVLEPLIEYGALGLFLIFMIVQYTLQGKKIDSQNNKFLNALEQIRSDQREREEGIRNEYKAQNELLRTELELVKQNHSEVFSQFRTHVINAHGHQKEAMAKIRTAIHTALDENRKWRQNELLRRARQGEEV